MVLQERLLERLAVALQVLVAHEQRLQLHVVLPVLVVDRLVDRLRKVLPRVREPLHTQHPFNTYDWQYVACDMVGATPKAGLVFEW